MNVRIASLITGDKWGNKLRIIGSAPPRVLSAVTPGQLDDDASTGQGNFLKASISFFSLGRRTSLCFLPARSAARRAYPGRSYE